MTDPKTHAQTTIRHGLTDDTNGLARFGWHPDHAIDFCVQVETLESRLHQAQHGLCKPGDEPETVENVLAAIERAMNFRVGGDEGAVNAKAILRELETKARASLAPAPAVTTDGKIKRVLDQLCRHTSSIRACDQTGDYSRGYHDGLETAIHMLGKKDD